MEVEEIRKLLEEKLNISYYLNDDNQKHFCIVIQKYCHSKRMYSKALSYYLDETIKSLNELGFEEAEIIHVIKNTPSLLHANKKDLFAKYLLLTILENKDDKLLRKNLLLNNPKYYVMGISTMYARIMFLLNKGEEYLTKWYVLKMTNKEFSERFGISYDQLIAQYPYDATKINEFLDWPGNEEIKEKLLGKFL